MRSFLVSFLLFGVTTALETVKDAEYGVEQSGSTTVDSYDHSRDFEGIPPPPSNHRGFNRLKSATPEFLRKFDGHELLVRHISKVANATGLTKEETRILLGILESNKPEIKREDRSDWTEEQWREDDEKELERQRKIKFLAAAEINDQEKLNAFFKLLDDEKLQQKELMSKLILRNLMREARKSNLSSELLERFLVEVKRHNPERVHWRPNMSVNEIRNNIIAYEVNWVFIKAESLKSANRKEQTELMRFFNRVENRNPGRKLFHRHGGPPHHAAFLPPSLQDRIDRRNRLDSDGFNDDSSPHHHHHHHHHHHGPPRHGGHPHRFLRDEEADRPEFKHHEDADHFEDRDDEDVPERRHRGRHHHGRRPPPPPPPHDYEDDDEDEDRNDIRRSGYRTRSFYDGRSSERFEQPDDFPPPRRSHRRFHRTETNDDE